MEKKNNPNVESDSTVMNKKNAAAASGVSGKTSKPSKVGSAIWKSVLVGGVPGILIGACGTAAFSAGSAASPGGGEGSGHSGAGAGAGAGEVIHEAHSVSDDMTFSEAFAAARAEVGPGGAFCWHGQVYGTHRGDDPEWLEMSDAERAEHCQAILSQVHAQPYTPTDDEPLIEPDPNYEHDPEEHATDPEEHAADPEEHAGEDIEGEVDVHIVGVENVELSDGSEVQVGVGEVDGMDAMFIDTTGDGEVDTVLIDVDGDGEVGLGEAFDAEGAGITMEDIQAEAELAATETPDDQLYAGMPDYTNDADMGSLA